MEKKRSCKKNVEKKIEDHLAPTSKSKSKTIEESCKSKQESAKYLDQLKRLKAEFDNYKKRVAREKEELRKVALDEVAQELLEVLDNIQRAICADNNSANNYQALYEGVKIVERQMLECLSKKGIIPLESVGKPFNTDFQEAVMVVPAEEEGIVVQEVSKGYLINGRLLREAKVVVGSGVENE
ncbi:MAG: nucleotide exchange factor GrpE [Candidatus Theseobacter exili]|nr:nucleotide exchange factor GrpE [Candidatus Theseobacter exili]